MLAVF